MKDQFWLLHALGPVPTNEADGGDLKWLGAIVEDVDDPEKEFDCRPGSVPFVNWKDYRQLEMNDVKVILQRTTGVGLKVKLAKAIGVDVDISGNVTNQAQRARVVGYKLRNEKTVLKKILDADNYRDKITRVVSSIKTTRWFVAGYLVAKPVAGVTNPAEPVDEEETTKEKPAQEEADPDDVTQQDGGQGSSFGAEGDPGILGGLGIPLEVKVRAAIKWEKRIGGNPTESHIFAVVYRALKKEFLGEGIRLGNGPTGEGAFGEGDGQAPMQEDVTAVVSLGDNSVAEEVRPTLESADYYVQTQEVGSQIFDNEADAKLFEDMFGGGLEFAFKEKLPDDEEEEEEEEEEGEEDGPQPIGFDA